MTVLRRRSAHDRTTLPAANGGQPVIAERVAAAVILLIVAALALDQWAEIRALRNGLSKTADAWTEADTLRAAAGYAQSGFMANTGLPDLCFGDQFADQGTKKLLRLHRDAHQSWETGALGNRPDKVDSSRFIYTHYPPGPHWLAGSMMVVLGPGKIGAYRSLPIAIGLLSILYLAWEMARHLGARTAAACLLVFVSLPMFTNMMHGLSYQGYALAMLLVELGLCLRLARVGWNSRWVIGALCVLGFIQGWLGFDYFFLVTLAPLTLWILERSPTSSWKLVALTCVACAAGYVLALLLHFVQVAAYYGSVSVAVRDFATVAHYRSASDVLDSGLRMQTMPAILWDYLATQTARPLHFNTPILFFAACGALALFLLRSLPRHTSMRPLLAIAVALLVSSCWVVFMPQHSAQHWHFIPRHYFLLIFITVLAIAASMREMREVRREDFPVLWLAVLPAAVLAASILRYSVLAPLGLAVLPLASAESMAAYALTTVVLLCGARRWGLAWGRMLLWAPLFYATTMGAFMWIRESLWPLEFIPQEFPPLRNITAAPSAIISAYCFAGVGWILFRYLERRGSFASTRISGARHVWDSA